MRKLLLNPTPLFRKLRQLSLLLTLLLALPQTAWGQTSYFTINYSTAGNPLNQVWVSDDNLSDVLGDGTMSYDKTNNVLTLNGIDLELSPDDTGWDLISCQDTNDHPSLTIKLAGTNKVTLGNHNPGFFYGKELTFIIDAGNPGSLTISTQDEWGGNLFENSFSGEPTIDPTYSNDLSLTQKGHTYIIKTPSTGYIDYGITIGDTPVTSENKDNVLGDGTISFTPATGSNPNTLTLSGANINDENLVHGITVTNLENLTIICAGSSSNTINTSSSNIPIYCTDASCDLTFTSEENDINYIQFNTNATSLVEGFKTVTYVENKAEQFLPQKQIGFITYNVVIFSNAQQSVSRFTTNYKTFRTSQSNQFTISGNGGITFDPSSCTLTFDDDVHLGVRPNNDERKACIKWGIDNDLTVVIAGECEIRGGSEVVNSSTHFYYPFENTSGNANRTISFMKKAGVTNANLTLTSIDYTDANLIHGFASISISSDLKRVNGLPNNNSASISAIYDISVAGAAVSVAEGQAGITPEGGSGKVYFDGTNNILTLDGANVTGMIKTGLENLTIKLKGTNTIVTSSNNNGIYSDKNTGTLTFTKEGTGASLNITSGVSVIRGFASLNLENSGLYTRSSTPYKMKSNAGYTRLADATKEETDTTAITSFYISESVTYQLWVAGNQVTGANVTGTNIAGTVTFNTTNNTLTLSGANIIGTIESSIGDLTIHLTGGNTIKATGSETSLINSTNAGTVTFETDATATSNQLSFLKSDGGYFDAIPINGFTVAYDAGLGYNSQSSEIIESLTIEYNNSTYKLHSSNANNIVGDGKVSYSYDSTNGCVLTLNNGNVGCIEWKISDKLTIAINGTCSVSNTGHTYAINSNGNGDVSFVKASGASNAELTLKWGSGNDPVAAPNSTLGSGLYWKPIAATQRIITDNPEFVIVGDYAISDGIPVNGATSGTITYNATDKLLTISSFSQTFAQDAIKTSVSGLKVKLVGESTISCNNGGSAFTASTTSASIQFVKNDANSKLTMVTSMGPLSNFANGAITYDELYYYYAGNDNYIIKPKNSPTIKFVKRNQADGSIPTTQSAYEYVAENSTIPLTYGTDFYAPKPVFSDDYQLSDSTRYVYSMSVDGVVEFELGGTDYHNSDKILYADNGKLNILKSGELTITCTFPGNLQNEPCSASYTLKITRVFNNPFANTPAEQIYATYYNENEDLALPDGIVAYVVTGVSGNSVTTTATGYLPQNTAVLLEKTGNVGTTITGYTGSAGNFNGNLLKYTSANAVVNTTGKEYILYKNEFVKATGNISGSCYLDLSGTNLPARGVLGIGNDGSTAIEGIDVEATEDETWYDLQGRRIQKPTKAGIYIVNGKKVIINNK